MNADSPTYGEMQSEHDRLLAAGDKHTRLGRAGFAADPALALRDAVTKLPTAGALANMSGGELVAAGLSHLALTSNELAERMQVPRAAIGRWYAEHDSMPATYRAMLGSLIRLWHPSSATLADALEAHAHALARELGEELMTALRSRLSERIVLEVITDGARLDAVLGRITAELSPSEAREYPAAFALECARERMD